MIAGVGSASLNSDDKNNSWFISDKATSKRKKQRPLENPNRGRKWDFHIGNLASLEEISLYNTLRILLPQEEIIRNDRSLLKGNEIDIYLPERKLGFEYDGLVFHSSLKGKGPEYHLQKTELAKEQGVRLVHVFEDEYLQRRSQTTQALKNILKLYDAEIEAESCTCQDVSPLEAYTFLNTYHIDMAGDQVAYYLGLYCSGRLLALLAIRTDGEEGYEIYRYATVRDIHVHGGFAKLIQWYHQRFPHIPLFVKCDRRYWDGNMYQKAGFAFLENTPPTCWYTKDFSFRTLQPKKDLKENGEDVEGFYKIYDCGYSIWKY